MALLFSAGGGRLGNQIINLIHLTAFSCEHEIIIYKVNDSFIESKDGSLIFEIKKNSSNWKLVKNSSNQNFHRKIFLKLLVRLIHFYFCVSPFKKSYKLGYKTSFPKFILGKYLGKKVVIEKIISESKSSNIVVSGWGLRDWELVKKHKKKIKENIFNGLNAELYNKSIFDKNFLVVHIRRTDFLKVNEFNLLNFSDKVWLKAILKLSSILSINQVVIFSDQLINNSLISSLEKNGIEVILPEVINENEEQFLNLFINYVSKASYIICNASTLALGISFIFHENIYLPSLDSDFKSIAMNEAHLTLPTSLTWN